MSVFKEDTFDCTVRLVGLGYKKPIVLDFASGSNPGGSWRSKQQGTQEESLCRRSDLGLLLEKKKYPIPVDRYHYIGKVTIEQTNNTGISCAVIASELRGITSRTEEYLIRRVDDLYKCAIDNKHDVIILGAWGCGAFKETDDDSAVMAQVFKKVMKKYDSVIRTVFAVLYDKNYKVFKKIID